MNFYKMYAEGCVEEYVTLSDDIRVLDKGCSNAEFQFLTHEPMECAVGEEGGCEYPDLIIDKRVPLISKRFRDLLDRLGVDNLFYKPVLLVEKVTGENCQYFLALPPCIDCLDFGRSRLEGYPLKPGRLNVVKVIDPVAVPSKVGNYKIFRFARVNSADIIVTEEVKKAAEKLNLENVCFSEALREC